MPIVTIPARINQTAAEWALDSTVYTERKILVTTDEYYTNTTVPKFKFADGVNTWDNLDYFSDVQLQLNMHTADNNNPHNVTKSQVGLALVDNTPDANKTLAGELSGTLSNAAVLNSAVLAKVLTGLNISGSSILNTDNLLQAFGKLQSQINGVLGGAIYQSVWNATTNSPALSDGTGTKGHYYVVSVAGTQNLGSGAIDFAVGDWAIHNGTIYQKVDNTDAVSSVNGFIGAVNLTTADIAEVTNLYFTTARVLATQLTGYVSGEGVVAATDTVLQAIQKLNGNISAIVSLTPTNLATLYADLSSDASLNDTDTWVRMEGGTLVKFTGTDLKAYLKTYFDTLYEPIAIFRQTVKLGWAAVTGLPSVSYRPSPLLVPQAPITSANAAYQFRTNRTVSSFIVLFSWARGNAPGTEGIVTLTLNNITKGTTTTVGTFDLLTNNLGTEIYTATLSSDPNDILEITLDTPPWTSNPTNWRIGVDISF